jgi:signal peptidase II
MEDPNPPPPPSVDDAENAPQADPWKPTEGATASVEEDPWKSSPPEALETASPRFPEATFPEEPGLDEPIAVGVPRLGTPRGAARGARDPSKTHPSYVFLALVSILTLGSDIGSKLWAEHRLEQFPPFTPIWQSHLTFTLARNRGGAWGLLQGASENVRRPFFLLVSVAAITFIVTLYRRLQPRQRALKWGLPLVLGGALGNVFDRIRYGWVIDFIDYKAEWVRKMNDVVGRAFPGSRAVVPTDHWPTFNVADVAICIGVALMAIDMFTAKRGRVHAITGMSLPPSASLPPPGSERTSESKT